MYVKKNIDLTDTQVEEKDYIPDVKLISEPIGPLVIQLKSEHEDLVAWRLEEERREKKRILENKPEILYMKTLKVLWTEKYIPRKFH